MHCGRLQEFIHGMHQAHWIERVAHIQTNGSCNIAITEGNTLLSDEELEWLVVLRINSSFMEFMRENYLSEIIQTQLFNMIVVDVTQTQDCSESEEVGG